MNPFVNVRSRALLLMGLGVAVLGLSAAVVLADPGDVATGQNRYKAIRAGAESLIQGRATIRNAAPLKGHRDRALDAIDEALTELDKSVRFADRNDTEGEKGKSIFDAGRGRAAVGQNGHPKIRAGAQSLIDAGQALDRGHDKFGGHRAAAIRAIHRALDELSAGVSD